MGFKAGVPRPANAGRRAGTPNKKTSSLLQKCEAKGIDVFESMLELAIECSMPIEKFRMLSDIAQYIYPKRKALEHSVEINPEIADAAQALLDMSKEEKIKMLKEEIAKLEGEK